MWRKKARLSESGKERERRRRHQNAETPCRVNGGGHTDVKFRSINFHYQSPASQISPFSSEKIKLQCMAAILDANMHIDTTFPVKAATKLLLLFIYSFI